MRRLLRGGVWCRQLRDYLVQQAAPGQRRFEAWRGVPCQGGVPVLMPMNYLGLCPYLLSSALAQGKAHYRLELRAVVLVSAIYSEC
jgi:hypothetical protein